MNVRQLYIQNENSERISCLLRSSFINDLSGLGFANEYSFLSARDGFFTPTMQKSQQMTVGGILSFIDRDTAYLDYRNCTTWVNAGEKLTLVYIPFGNVEYYEDVAIQEISKGELDVGGYLSCDISFVALTPWYSSSVQKITFATEVTQGIKQYDYVYDYRYGLDRSPGTVNFTVDGDYDAGLYFTALGPFTDPVLTLYETNSLKRIGRLDLTGTSLTSGETLVFATTAKDAGVWKQVGTTLTDLIDAVQIHQGEEIFFHAPRNKSLTLQFAVDGLLAGEAAVSIYKYWKTR